MNILVAGWPLSVAKGGRQDNRGMGESRGVSAEEHSQFDERNWGVSACATEGERKKMCLAFAILFLIPLGIQVRSVCSELIVTLNTA